MYSSHLFDTVDSELVSIENYRQYSGLRTKLEDTLQYAILSLIYETAMLSILTVS
jgi:hypothetical protein